MAGRFKVMIVAKPDSSRFEGASVGDIVHDARLDYPSMAFFIGGDDRQSMRIIARTERELRDFTTEWLGVRWDDVRASLTDAP